MTARELDVLNHVSCILEIDILYADHSHNIQNDYPLALERVQFGKVEKPVPHLVNKSKYIVYLENLQLYESVGLKLQIFVGGIKFEESAWLTKVH